MIDVIEKRTRDGGSRSVIYLLLRSRLTATRTHPPRRLHVVPDPASFLTDVIINTRHDGQAIRNTTWTYRYYREKHIQSG